MNATREKNVQRKNERKKEEKKRRKMKIAKEPKCDERE